ncbi:FAD-binding oxidoreductase [Aspergillus undulatus]|uniref:FAD-binding oxidoreductase n=1 Tax=Aspergillus undulatus TaxID=1810928 RepID=UPI003CCE1377
MAAKAEQVLDNLRIAGLGDVLYLPGEDAYNDRVASHWSLTAQLKPWAIVQPRTTEEVSKAVKAIVDAPDVRFAVRSGGHMQWAGASSIADGITIDLGLMASTTYDAKTEIASLQPGGSWAVSYKELEKHGRMVAGGREGKVGIAGLLTGGGKTFYTCRVGWGCDQIVNYEVVLADGSIVNANSETNPDLFRAVKGGGNNFGIMTRFDMVTFPAKNIWNATQKISKQHTAEVVEALIHFEKNLSATPNDHILVMWTYIPKAEDHIIVMDLVNLDGQEDAETLGGFLSIPGQRDDYTTSVATKLETFIVPSGRHDTWFTLTFKADARIILKASEVFEALIETVKTQIPDHNFSSQMVLQPLAASFAQHSVARGGNMLGTERIKDDCIILVWALEVATAELNETVGRPALRVAIDEIESFAKSVDGDVDFRYLNYCDGSQDPITRYGEENVRKMREVSQRVDPDGVFQRRVPGGFKIPKA